MAKITKEYPQVTCLHCGFSGLIARRSKRKYCNAKCRVAAMRKRTARKMTAWERADSKARKVERLAKSLREAADKLKSL